jgi:hypothetical protein
MAVWILGCWVWGSSWRRISPSLENAPEGLSGRQGRWVLDLFRYPSCGNLVSFGETTRHSPARRSVGNLANLSLLSSAVPGPEQFLAGRPLMLVTLVAAQIVLTLWLTGLLARGPKRSQAGRGTSSSTRSLSGGSWWDRRIGLRSSP